jgi:hypothetical protein
MLPEGASPLTAADVYVHYIEAANNNFVGDRFMFLGKSTLRNIANDAGAGVAFMNSHRNGGLSTPAEFPFGKTFAGQYQEGTNESGEAFQRAMFGLYMLRGVKPNGENGPSTDDLDKKIRGGTLFDVSIGLKARQGQDICDVCSNDLNSEKCQHIPGTVYGMTPDEIKLQKDKGVTNGAASYTHENGRLGEVSGVFDGAVPAAGFRKALALQSELVGSDRALALSAYKNLWLSDDSQGDYLNQLIDMVAEGVAERLGTPSEGQGDATGVRAPSKKTMRASLSDNGEKTMAKDKNWFQRIFGGLDGDERKEALAALSEGNEGAPPPPSSSSQGDSAEVKELRARAAAYEARMEKDRKEAAAKFAGDLVIAKSILPVAKDKVAALYLRHAEDDHLHPVAEGATSRVEQFKAMFADLPKHHLTDEYVSAEQLSGALVLNPDAGTMDETVKQAAASARAYGERANPKTNLSVAK